VCWGGGVSGLHFLGSRHDYYYISLCSFLFFVFMDDREVLRWWSYFVVFENKNTSTRRIHVSFTAQGKLFFSNHTIDRPLLKRCQLLIRISVNCDVVREVFFPRDLLDRH
jgi:hypothetical protein